VFEFAPIRQRRYWPALALVAIGACLRVWLWARGQALWLDEQMIAMNLRDRTLATLAGRLDHEQSAPLGWMAIERIVLVVVGEGEMGLRVQPLLWGLATLAVAWLIGRRWLGTLGLTVFVALFALSPTLVAYSAQVKHYSADVFWAALLLLLAGLVAEQPADRRRVAAFWLAAVVGIWFSMGAFLALPALAAVLLVQAWIRGRLRVSWPHLAGGALFLAVMAANYLLVLRHATGNQYLNKFWSGVGYPPEDGGPLALAKWFPLTVGRLSESPFALVDLHAGGAGRLLFGVAALFWLLAVVGLVAVARRRPELGLLLLASLASSVVLAMLQVVPLAARLAMWTMPVVFAAVAVGVEVAAKALKRGAGLVRAKRVAPGAAVLAMSLVGLSFLPALTPQLVRSSVLAFGEPELNDREAIAWMINRHRQGDVVVYVSSAGRAASWYDREGRLSPARSVITVPATSDCRPEALWEAVRSFDRVIVYSGVQYVPYLETPEMLKKMLIDIGGQVIESKDFGTVGTAYVVELYHGPALLSVSMEQSSPLCLVVA